MKNDINPELAERIAYRKEILEIYGDNSKSKTDSRILISDFLSIEVKSLMQLMQKYSDYLTENYNIRCISDKGQTNNEDNIPRLYVPYDLMDMGKFENENLTIFDQLRSIMKNLQNERTKGVDPDKMTVRNLLTLFTAYDEGNDLLFFDNVDSLCYIIYNLLVRPFKMQHYFDSINDDSSEIK